MAVTYTPATNFGAKDSLPTNDPDKVIKGSEFTTEFTAIQTAFGLAAPAASPTFTGTVTIASVDINGGTIDGVTIGGSSAGAITGTTGQFNTSLNVDGTVTADGLTVDGATVLDVGDEGTLQVGPTTTAADENQTIEMRGSNGSNELQRFQISNRGEDGTVDFKYGRAGATPTKAISIGSGTGDISFYEDTGTTAKFFWDASAERLGIGTTSPSYKLDLKTTGSPSVRVRSDDAGGTATLLLESANTFSGTSQAYIKGIGTAGSGLSQLSFGTAGSSGDTSATERMRIDSSGNVGIGTTSPQSVASGYGALTIGGTTGGGINFNSTGSAFGQIYGNNTNVVMSAFGSRFIAFNTNGTEAARIDSSGNLLVGKTVTTFNTPGFLYETGGAVEVTRSGNRVMRLNRTTNDGSILEFNKGATTVGSIGTASGGFYLGNAASSAYANIRFTDNEVFPCESDGGNNDDAIDLGKSNSRWRDIYATNGTIQTSDRNEKQDIEELSEAERRVAVAAKGLLRKFRWISSVEEKGDDARIHFGIIAQDLQAAFEAEGLDAGRYAMFIHSTWTDEETGEERSRMGVRYSELLAFIIAAL
jgi:hypothetical protein